MTALLIAGAWTLIAVTYAFLPPWPWPLRLGFASLTVTLAMLMVGALLRVTVDDGRIETPPTAQATPKGD